MQKPTNAKVGEWFQFNHLCWSPIHPDDEASVEIGFCYIWGCGNLNNECGMHRCECGVWLCSDECLAWHVATCATVLYYAHRSRLRLRKKERVVYERHTKYFKLEDV